MSTASANTNTEILLYKSLYVPGKEHIVLNFLLPEYVHEPCIFITHTTIKQVCLHIYRVSNEFTITDTINRVVFNIQTGTVDDLCKAICNYTVQKLNAHAFNDFVVTTNFGYPQSQITKAIMTEVITPIVQCLLFTVHRSLSRAEDILAESKELRRREALREASSKIFPCKTPPHRSACTYQ